MHAETVFHQQLCLGELQQGGAEFLIRPADLGILDDDASLPQQPIREGAGAARAIQGDAGQVDDAIGGAPDGEACIIDVQPAQARFQKGQGPPGPHGLYLGQDQGVALLGLESYVAQGQAGIDAVPVRHQGIDVYRHPHGLAGRGFQVRPEPIHIRHDPEL